MYTDYKFWYIKRDDDGFIIEAAIRFFEGEYQTKVIEGKEQEVYVRTKRLDIKKGELDHLTNEAGEAKLADEVNGKSAIVYTPDDFGRIQKDDELCEFLNKQITKDQTREVVPEQIQK